MAKAVETTAYESARSALTQTLTLVLTVPHAVTLEYRLQITDSGQRIWALVCRIACPFGERHQDEIGKRYLRCFREYLLKGPVARPSVAFVRPRENRSTRCCRELHGREGVEGVTDPRET